ncbi:hypothetical protein HGP29_27235 [Flammeovirga sp. SR4]|uniref:Uncharacterized protein n=1 Tax=Flammeovirga agarivorans TaxID=2726742 RepID=A0A7X8SRC2_9BACT|nr:hypothetical protein [Flammeovirga agarivorans]
MYTEGLSNEQIINAYTTLIQNESRVSIKVMKISLERFFREHELSYKDLEDYITQTLNIQEVYE